MFLNAFLLKGPATGYELSVYDAMGPATWAMGIGSLVCALSAITLQPEDFQKGRRRFMVVVSVLLTCLVIVALPLARVYVSLDRHDELTQIGITNEIANSGNLWTGDFYPALHLETVASHFSAGIDVYSSHLALMPVYALLFVLAAYSLSRCLFKDKLLGCIALISISAPLVLMTPRYFVPTDASFAVIPLVLYSQMRAISDQNRRTWRIVLCIFLLVAVIYHPQLCIVLSAAILLIPFSRWLYERSNARRRLPNQRNKSLFFTSSIFSVFFLWVCYVLWLSRFPLFLQSISSFIRTLEHGIQESPAVASANYGLSNAGLSPGALLELVVNTYGMYLLIIFGALAFFALTRASNLPSSLHWPRIYLLVSLLVYMVISISTFVGNFVLPFGRVFVFVLLYSELLFMTTSTSYSAAPHRQKGKRRSLLFRRLVVVFVLSVFVALAVGGFYSSPRTGQYNTQVTQSNFDGQVWLMDHKNKNVTVMEILGVFGRYLDAVLGPSISRERPDALYYVPETVPPPHFGYGNNTTLGSQYLTEKYLCYDRATLDYYGKVFPTQGSYYTSDFISLNEDSTVSRIMDNGGFVCYVVVPF